MADFIMEDIEIEEDQEYVLTDPDLYVNRFNKAIEEQRFDDALFEAEKAIEYGNDAKKYQIVKLQAFFASGRYQDCLDYIDETGLWYKRGELEKDIVDILYKINAECLQYLYINRVKNERIILGGHHNLAEQRHYALSQREIDQIKEYIDSFAGALIDRFDTVTVNRICRDYKEYLEIETRSGRELRNVIEELGSPETAALNSSLFRDNGMVNIVKVTNRNCIILSQRAFIKALKQTIFSMKIIGELLEISDGFMNVASTDGHRISSRTIPTKSGVFDLKAIIPGRTIEKIISSVNDNIDGDMRIFLNDDSILFMFVGVVITSKLSQWKFPALSEEYTSEIMINRSELCAVLEKAVSLNYGMDVVKAIVFDISNSNMIVSMNTPNGAINQKIKLQKGGADIKIGFNPQFLLDAMKNIDNEFVNISFKNHRAPCLISDEKSYSYTVLPINIYSDEYINSAKTNNNAMNNSLNQVNSDSEKAGVSKGNSSDKNGVLNELELLANYGDPDALYKMGILYSTGDGVKQDEALALEYFMEAANSGHSGARSIIEQYNNKPPKDNKSTFERIKYIAANPDDASKDAYELGYEFGKKVKAFFSGK